jgi:hypothetical protein
VVIFPSADVARAVADDLNSRVLAQSGWHIYSQMEHLLRQRTASMKGPPFFADDPNKAAPDYWPGMLPQTDDLVGRAMSIGIGVADANLGSTFGVTVVDDSPAVERVAERFREAAGRHLATT